MKKNFFKKLSFVLALAMIMSTIAPAGAFAATKKPKLNSAKEYLFLGSGNDEKFDFNVKNTVKGYKYKWTSADKAIATVNQSGVVTAKSIGTTKVSVIVKNSKGKEVSSLKASVIVKDNIASLKITGTPAGDKVAVGKENAFTYSYTTKSGSTSKTTSVVAWKVDKAGATITDAGKFVATAAGSYKVTATAYQSKAKLAAGTALCSADYTVTVPNEIKSVTATKLNQLKVTFSSAATAVDKANFTVTNSATTSKLFVKAVTLSDDKTSATIDLYDTLVSGTTYSVAAKVDGADMTGEVKFVKGNVSKIVAPTSQVVQANTSTNITYAVYDENGLDVTADTPVVFDSLLKTVTTNGQEKLAKGQLDYVYVIYTVPTTGVQVKSDKITVSGVDSAATDLVAYSLCASWENSKTLEGMFTRGTVTSIAYNDAQTYYVRIEYKDQYGNKTVPAVVTSSDSLVRFYSLDPTLFVVDEFSGKLILNSQGKTGTGYVRIKVGSVDVTKPITIRDNSTATSLKPDTAQLSVSDTGNKGLTNADLSKKLNTATTQIQVFDNANQQSYTADQTLKIEVLNGNKLLTVKDKDGIVRLLDSNDTAPVYIKNYTDVTFAAASGITSSGTVSLKISGVAGDAGTLSSAYCILNVNVSVADDKAVNYVVAGAQDYDINDYYDGFNWTWKDTVDTTLRVFSVNSANFKVNEIKDATLDILGPNNKSVTATAEGYVFNPTNADNPTKGPKVGPRSIFAGQTGAYTVVAKNTSGFEIARASFNVKDTGSAPSLAFKSSSMVCKNGKLTLAALQDNISGLGGYNITGFKFDSPNTTIVAGKTTLDASDATVNGSTTIYNITVSMESVVTDPWTGDTFTRVFTQTLPSLSVSLY